MSQTTIKPRASRHRLALTAMGLALAAFLCLAVSSCNKAAVPGKTETPDKTETSGKTETDAMAGVTLGEDGDAILASREQGGIMPSLQGYTLADAFAALSSQLGKCKATRPASGKICLIVKGDRGEMEVNVTLAEEKELGAVAVVEGAVMESGDDSEPRKYGSAKTHAMLMQFIQDDRKVTQQKEAARLKEIVANMPDGKAQLTWREPGGGLSTDTMGSTLADALKCLASITPRVDPTVERDGEKVRIVRISGPTNMVAVFTIADGENGGKAAVVESFLFDSGNGDPKDYTDAMAYRVVCGLIAKTEEAEFLARVPNGGQPDSGW